MRSTLVKGGKADPQDREQRRADARGRELLSVPEAARYLGVTERFIRRSVVERRFPYLKLGGLVRFEPADLDAYRRACRVEPGRD